MKEILGPEDYDHFSGLETKQIEIDLMLCYRGENNDYGNQKRGLDLTIQSCIY